MTASADTAGSLEALASALRSRVNRHAWLGLAIGLSACLIATLLHCLFDSRGLSWSGMMHAQANNPGLWLLDLMPFAFLVWGQYIGHVMSYQAGAMILDETRDLREQTRQLSDQLDRAQRPATATIADDRSALRDDLDLALAAHQHGDGRIRLLMIGSDDYRALSHEAEDDQSRLDEQIRRRLGRVLDDRDRLYVLGGDRYAVILNRDGDDSDGQRLATRLHLAFDTPVNVRAGPLGLRLQIGIAHGPRHGHTAEQLIRHAESAAHLALVTGQETQVYDADAYPSADHRAHLLADLYGALEHEALSADTIVQQCRTGDVQRLRLQPYWDHPRRGRLAAGAFMDLPERSNLLHALTLWCLTEGLSQCEQTAPGATSALVLRPPERAWQRLPLAELILRLLNAHDVAPERLTLELPAGLLSGRHPELASPLAALNDAGVRLGIAAQGLLGPVPAAALVYPLREARLSADWVHGAIGNPRGERLLHLTVEQLRALDLRITLSGVESAAHRALADSLAVDFIEHTAPAAD